MLPSALDTGGLEVLEVVVEGGRSVVGHGCSSAKAIKASRGPSIVPRDFAILLEVTILMRRPCRAVEHDDATDRGVALLAGLGGEFKASPHEVLVVVG